MMADQRYHGHVGGAVIHALCLSSSMVIAKARSRTLHADLSLVEGHPGRLSIEGFAIDFPKKFT